MAQFDKTFPTLDCSACILTPKMSEAGQHENVTLLTYSELEEVSGSVGNFKVKIRQKARKVDYDLCTGCGICVEKCPRKVLDTEFEAGMGNRKAIYMPFPQAVPRIPVLDTESCIWFERQQVPGLREALPDRRHQLRPGRRDDRAERRQHHHRHRLEAVRLPARFRSTATAGWRTSSRAWSSSGCATRPARPTARSCCATARPNPKVGGHHPLRRQPRREPQPALLGRLLHGRR